MTGAEYRVASLVSDLTVDALLERGETVNLCNIIAAQRGWNPLEIGETMTVGFCDGTEYTITRNHDRKAATDGK